MEVSTIGPHRASEAARYVASPVRFDAWRSRRLALSIGLAFWGLGTGIVWWLAAAFPTVEPFDAAFWTFANAAMLAALVAAIGSTWSLRTGPTSAVADPRAQAWWVLNAYPILPATGVLFALRDAGALSWEQHPLASLVVWAVLLFARGAVLLSPAGPRALRAIEARGARPGERMPWLVSGAGAAYVLAALVTFAATMAGLFWLGVAASLGGLIGISVSVAVLARWVDGSAAATDRDEQWPAG